MPQSASTACCVDGQYCFSWAHYSAFQHRRIQLDYLKKEAAAGRLPAWVPPEAEPARSLLQTVGVPAFTQRYHQDPELALATSMSKSMWTSNPGTARRRQPQQMYMLFVVVLTSSCIGLACCCSTAPQDTTESTLPCMPSLSPYTLLYSLWALLCSAGS